MLNINIEYRIKPGSIIRGDLDNVPLNAYGAHVYQTYPSYIDNYGNVKMSDFSFDLFVGKKINIEDYDIDQINDDIIRNKLIQLKNNGINYAVIPAIPNEYYKKEIEIWPLYPNDRVYSSYLEFKKAILVINNTYNNMYNLVKKKV